jgi:hypothetical protein
MSEKLQASVLKKQFPWIDSLTERLTSTGLSWARQSLSMGKRALETSAKTLSQTAGSLDEWEKKLDRPKPEVKPASEAPAPEAAA